MKRLFSLLICAVIAISVFGGCTSDNTTDIEVSAIAETETVDLTTAETTTTAVETTAVETTAAPETKAPETKPAAPVAKPEKTVPAWKSAYINYVEGRSSKNNCEYRLVYVDNDNIPELFISGSCEAEGSLVCTYYGGRVVEQHLTRLAGAYYIPKSGLIYNCNGNSGCYGTEVYRLSYGKFTLLFKGLNTVTTQESLNEFGEYEYTPVSQYFLFDASGNKYEVSEQEYLNACGKYFNKSNSEALYRYNDSRMYKYPYIKQAINIF